MHHQLRKLALSFPEASEEPHFEKTSFRVRKKIFATLDEKGSLLTVKLSPVDQDVFCTINPDAISSVPNRWGKQGWTLIDLEKVSEEALLDALTTAYCEVAPAKLAAQLRPPEQPAQ
ncbi:MAG: MmcQ/YjbR family DNA-binding protein [Bacteroidia bacterium]